ncbi:MAG: hypothetical protein GF368_00890 [Candidatus Aenigmarchaeota archaeon]|nr:hypothetical protein [Candidatus Aenigmarchaeota archaeon]
MPPPRIFLNTNFWIELVYSFVTLISCLVIYFKTNEIYKLSSHKGLKYFRLTFLFLGITYSLRFFARMFLLNLIFSGTMIPVRNFSGLTSFLLLYTNFMTLFYLLYGLSNKIVSKSLPESTDVLHMVAILLSSAIWFLNLRRIFILLNLPLMIYILYLGYLNYKKSKKKKASKFHIIYFLLVVFLMLNVFDILIPDFFRNLQNLIYLSSISIILIILYKVFKILSVDPNGKKE